MKKILFAPLLLTLLVGCGNTDKTFIERRDDYADAVGGAISIEELDKKHYLCEINYWSIEGTRMGFCSFYRIGERFN